MYILLRENKCIHTPSYKYIYEYIYIYIYIYIGWDMEVKSHIKNGTVGPGPSPTTPRPVGNKSEVRRVVTRGSAKKNT
jgi:hypothetical protein